MIEAGRTLKVLATNRIGQGSSGNNGGSPAVADGRIYVRSFEFLYCIGEKKSDH